MSATRGGPFTLIGNTGRLDKLIVSYVNLQKMIIKSRKVRKMRPMQIISEIRKSHSWLVHDIFKPHVPIGSDYYRIEGSAQHGGGVEFNLLSIGDFVTDMGLYIKFNSITSATNYYRYVAKPGIKVLLDASLTIDNNEITRYERNDVIQYDKTLVGSQNREAWDQCIGQDLGLEAVYNDLGHQATDVKKVRIGPQTYKHTQDELELFIPFLFWFCKDPAQALPFCALGANSKRQLNINLENLQSMVVAKDSTGADIPLDQTITIKECTLYVNNVYTMPDVKDLYMSRAIFKLMKTKLSVRKTLTTATDYIQLKPIKWPCEYFTFGIQPIENQDDPDNYLNYNKLTEREICFPMVIGTPKQLVSRGYKFYQEDPVIRIASVGSFSNVIVDPSPMKFYEAYNMNKFISTCDISSNNNKGVGIHAFAIYPTKWDTLGYFNFSRFRETYINYESNVGTITAASPAMFYLSAECNNFILISDGSMSIRFSS
jgi:hypothetical protein